MKCKTMVMMLLMGMLMSQPVFAELGWNSLSLKLFGGPSENGGRFGREGWEHEYEMGLSGTMVVNEKHEVEMALSKWDVKSDDVSAYWEDTANKFSLTGRRKYLFPSIFVPWWEAGVDLALIDTYKRTVVDNESNNPHEDEYSLTAFGAHVGVGVDIYPIEQSAIAITVDCRYTGYFTTSDINGPSILVGVRWDFFQRGLGRRNYKRVDHGDRKPIQETPVWMR